MNLTPDPKLTRLPPQRADQEQAGHEAGNPRRGSQFAHRSYRHRLRPLQQAASHPPREQGGHRRRQLHCAAAAQVSSAGARWRESLE